MKLNILRADPAGNITVFVLDPVERAQRAAIAARIMAIPSLKAEQVAFYEVDREIWPDIRAVEKMIRSGELLDIVKEYIPDFE